MPPKRPTLIVLGLITLAPFLSVQYPALGDTLNHLARMHVLATIGHSPALQRFYSVHWSPIPYLAMDAIVPLLARVLPIYLAGKLFVCACVLMPALGTISLHYAVHRRVSLVPAASLLLCTNYLLALGFLNYLFSAGAAVTLFAGWYAASGWGRWWRALAFAPLLLLLYFGHAFACLAYCLAVAGLEGARALRHRTRSSVLDILAAASQAVPALAFAANLHVSAGYVGALQTSYGNLPGKLLAAASPMLFLLDPVHLGSIVAVLVLGVAAARHLRAAPAIWPAVLVVGVAACAMPHVAASTWGMDLRLPLVAGMILIGGLSWTGPAAARLLLLAALCVLLVLRAADDRAVLRRIDAQITDTRRLLAVLPPGARLLVVNADGHGTGLERVTQSTAWHMPLVAVIDRDAFVPYLFNGLTTVQVNGAYRLSSTPNGLPISPTQLMEGAANPDDGREHGDGLGARLYYPGWPAKFDDVLVQGGMEHVPDVLRLVGRGEGMALYRVTQK